MRIIVYELFIIIVFLDIKVLEIIWKVLVFVCELFFVFLGRFLEEYWLFLVYILVLLYYIGIIG